MRVTTPGAGARTRREQPRDTPGRFVRSDRRGGACPRPRGKPDGVRCAKTGDHNAPARARRRPYEPSLDVVML